MASESKPKPLRFPKRKLRKCLKCQKVFISLGCENRLCDDCNYENKFLSKTSMCKGEAIAAPRNQPSKKGDTK